MDLDVERQLGAVRVDRADHHTSLRRTLLRQQRLLQQQESLRVLVEAIAVSWSSGRSFPKSFAMPAT